MNPYFEQYYHLCSVTASDINEHLPVLKEYADQCNSVLELGHRRGVSTSAFLVSKARCVHSVDIKACGSWDRIAYQLDQSDSPKKEFAFFQADALLWKSPRLHYELIFIDDLHEGNHLLQELQKYSKMADRWMILHDTEHFAWEGEYIPSTVSKGLQWALIRFFLETEEGKHWHVREHYRNNNGLTVLEWHD